MTAPFQRVDDICDAFEAAWLAGDRPKIERFVGQVNESARDELLRELLLAEWELAERDGRTINARVYQQRFPKRHGLIRDLYRERKRSPAGQSVRSSFTKTSEFDGSRPKSESSYLIIRCPHCQDSNRIIDDSSLNDITCSTCGSRFSLVDDEQETQAARTLKEIAHFQLIELLGRGGFGCVWKARDTRLDRLVAVKVPRRGSLTADESEQLLREARAAAQLSHPNIVSVHEVGRDADTVFIVSDLVHGSSLAEWRTVRKPSFREATSLCAKLAGALHHAHESGVIHRDLKPQNVLIDDFGEPHLMDFGLARRDTGEITMTLDGHVLGTPAYMSPEQARGEGHRADRRTDIYSLGVILYELLTGELPFRGNARMMIQQVLSENPPAPRRLNAAVPRDLENITLKCLEKEVERRYSFGRELSEDLQRYLHGKPVRARPISFASRSVRWCKRHPAIASLTAMVSMLLLLLIVGGPLVAIRQARLAEDYRRSLYLSDLQSAIGALEAGDLARAVNLLERHRPAGGQSDLRTFEWHLLWKQCQPGLTTLDLAGHVNEPSLYAKASRHLVYSSTGDLAAAHFDGTLTIWRDGALLRRLAGHVGYAQCVVFSGDGKLLASCGDDRLVKIWDVETGKLLREIKTGNSAWSLAFLGNIIVASSENRVCRWNARTGKYLGPIPKSDLLGYGARFAITRDGTLMARSDRHGVTLQDLQTNEITGRWRAYESFAFCLSFSKDNKYLATGGGDEDPTVKVWNVQTQGLVCTLHGHTKRVRSVCMSPTDDDVVASVSWDKKVKLWSISQAKEIATLIGHSASLFTMDFAPHGEILATAGVDGAIRLWDIAGMDKGRLLGNEPAPTSLAFSRDGDVVSADRKKIMFWGSHSGRLADQAFVRSVLKTDWNDVACSPVAPVYAAFSESNVVLVDYETQQVRRTLHHESRLSCLAYSPSGSLLATGSWDGQITLWDLDATRRTSWAAHQQKGVDATTLDNFWGQPHVVHDLVFVNEETLVSIGADHTLRIWSIATDQEQTTLMSESKTFRLGQSLPRAAALSTDGRLLAIGDDFGYLSFWRTRPFERVAAWFAHSKSGVMALAFVPNSDTLISGGFDGTLRFWDTHSRSLRMSMDAKTVVYSIAVTADGQQVAWAGEDGVVRLLRTR